MTNTADMADTCCRDLLIAAIDGHQDCVKSFVDEGADVNMVDLLNRTPLSYTSDVKCAKLLIQAGADVNTADSDGGTALMYACLKGHVEHVKLLIEAGSDINALDNIYERHDDLNSTPIMYAAGFEQEECVKLLIQAGADVNKAGDTALMCAARSGHKGCIEALIEAGADVNATVCFDEVPTEPDVATSSGIGETPLMFAVKKHRENRAELLKLLLDTGADVNLIDTEGETVLMKAAEASNDDVVENLIELGMDVNATDNKGATALIFAAKTEGNIMSGCLKCIRILLKAGAHVNKTTEGQGMNALQTYTSKREGDGDDVNEDVAMLLFAAGEMVGDTITSYENSDNLSTKHVLDYLLQSDLRLCLKHLCREAIRKHLIDLDPHQHLFGRIPQLGLPSSLTEYLLFNISLETSVSDDEEQNLAYKLSQVI